MKESRFASHGSSNTLAVEVIALHARPRAAPVSRQAAALPIRAWNAARLNALARKWACPQPGMFSVLKELDPRPSRLRHRFLVPVPKHSQWPAMRLPLSRESASGWEAHLIWWPRALSTPQTSVPSSCSVCAVPTPSTRRLTSGPELRWTTESALEVDIAGPSMTVRCIPSRCSSESPERTWAALLFD